MIAASLLLALLAAQDAPVQDAPMQDADASADVVYDDIVVEATVGRVALLFDRRADGRLENCRVLVSSGDAEIDATACDDLPDCITDSEGRNFCDGVPTPAAGWDARAVTVMSAPAAGLAMPRLVTPEAPVAPGVGPAPVRDTADVDPNRLTKLPPPPRDTTGDGPTVSFGPGHPPLGSER